MALSGKTVLKADVKEHWERETCGTRYGNESDRKLYFDEISVARYKLEPYIHSFADFQSASGKAVLEIGVGAGTDFQNWCKYAAHATGVDLTEKAISLTDERLKLNSKIGFSGIELSTRLGPGDLLMIKPSKKYNSTFFNMIWKIYPRWLVRLIGDRYGLGLFINASKPKRSN